MHTYTRQRTSQLWRQQYCRYQSRVGSVQPMRLRDPSGRASSASLRLCGLPSRAHRPRGRQSLGHFGTLVHMTCVLRVSHAAADIAPHKAEPGNQSLLIVNEEREDEDRTSLFITCDGPHLEILAYHLSLNSLATICRDDLLHWTPDEISA